MFNKNEGQQPITQYEYAALGEMVWSADGEVWVGAFRDVTFWIAYEYSSTPKQEILQYASSILSDEYWLGNILREVREKLVSDYGAAHKEDADKLTIATLSFHNSETFSIHFFKGNNSPWWIADVSGRNLVGVAMDT